MSMVSLKIAAIAVILLTALGFGLSPLRIGQSDRSERLFSWGAAVAGGVFLAAGLVHMLPDAVGHLRSLEIAFPVSFFIAGLGFLLVFGIEKALAASHDVGGAAGAGETASPYILALILSIHSVIAGISLGAERTLAGASIIFIAIIGHKGTAAFALGVSLLRARVARAQMVRLIVLFSSMTPLGVLIGTVMSSLLTGRGADICEGVFDSVAAGTFLYVATLDIISEEFSRQADRRLKFALLALGFAFMSMLALWT